MDERILIPTAEPRAGHRDANRSAPRRAWLVVVGLLAAIAFLLAQRPGLQWTRGEPPQRLLNAESVVATPGAFSVLAGVGGEGGAVWTTADGERWLRRSLPRIGYRVAYHPTGLFIIDGRTLSVVGPDDDDPPVTVPLPDAVRIGNGSGRAGLVSGLGGMVAQTVTGDIYYAPDGRRFSLAVAADDWRASADVTGFETTILSVPPPRIRSACQPVERRSPDVVPIVVAGDRLMAFLPEADPSIAWPVCEPVLWSSTEGFEWEPTSDESPFPAGAYVSDVDWRDGRFVAVGGVGFERAVAWTSTDGAAWEPLDLVDVERGSRFRHVEQGGLGWMIVTDRTNDSRAEGWFSTDGLCWDKVRSGVIGPGVAINDDAVISVGRSPDPEIWIGRFGGLAAGLGVCGA